ncbi:MAG: hypothetical protein MNPFHGCM_03010 [Gemmatimonadaceae bacterium]|nr:hypothetical protein [Gemmatimonadaceae bacterium]
MKSGPLGALLSILAPVLVPLRAQVLTLDRVLDRADRSAYAVRAAQGAADAQRAQSTATLRAFLPSIRADAGLVKTTDPIGAFGNTLRQRIITQADFDPARLNFPDVSSNWTGALVIEQPLVNADAVAARAAASHMQRAAQRSTEWVVIETRVNAIRAYYGATLATIKVGTLEAALRAAHAHVSQAEQSAINGMVTPSDALLAAVKAGEVEARLVQAQGDAASAKLALAIAMGTPADTMFALPSVLPAIRSIETGAAAAIDGHSRPRADVVAAAESQEATSADRWRAKALAFPRINSFARYDWNSPARVFNGDRNWTVGVMASWSIFSGAANLAERQATHGRAEQAEAMRDAADAKATLDLQQSRSALQAALARLTIATRALAQSIDAHRIVGRRYDAGLASVVELLDAAAGETQIRLALVGAQYDTIVATAERLKALGLDPAALRILDGTAEVASPNDRP